MHDSATLTTAELVSDLLKVTSQALIQERNRYWAAYDLTSTQIDVMFALVRKHNLGDVSPTSQAWLQSQLHLSNATVSGVITRLEAKELIRRVPLASGPHKYNICLTDKAKELNLMGLNTKSLLETHLLEGFSEQDVSVLVEQLKRIYRNIQDVRSLDDQYLR